MQVWDILSIYNDDGFFKQFISFKKSTELVYNARHANRDTGLLFLGGW